MAYARPKAIRFRLRAFFSKKTLQKICKSRSLAVYLYQQQTITQQQNENEMKAIDTNNQEKVMILTAGLPAAGKSSYLRKANINLPIVDPDKIKEQHPEYDPKNPQNLHEWSKGRS